MDDYTIALLLQEEYDNEVANSGLYEDCYYVSESLPKKSHSKLSIVDKKWELLDPNPDIRTLFMEFNSQFFQNKLSGVEVKWSPRMTLCAGLCCYEGHGGLCSIRLSLPLLKLRSRKDLVETLLHEMIHAYLFVTHSNKDRSDHGPEFLKHMTRINNETGANITVYHSYHDEVDLYRQHWWRCNGLCQRRKPYYGYVRRATNRAPSDKDYWWAEHKKTCGGSFTKIKEPEGYKEKQSKRKKEVNKINTGDNTKKPKSSETAVQIQNTSSFNGKGYVLGGLLNHSRLLDSIPSASGFNQNENQWAFDIAGTITTSSNSVAKPKNKGENNLVHKKTGKITPKLKNVITSPSKNVLNLLHFFPKTSVKKDTSDKQNSNNSDSQNKPRKEITKLVTTTSDITLTNHHEKCVSCPLCKLLVLDSTINDHLDVCLQICN